MIDFLIFYLNKINYLNFFKYFWIEKNDVSTPNDLATKLLRLFANILLLSFILLLLLL